MARYSTLSPLSNHSNNMQKIILWKIKPGKRQVWEDWCTYVVDKRHDEAALSLTEEDLVREHNHIFGEGDESYVVFIHQALPGKKKKPANLDRELNRTHFAKIKECLEEVTPGVLGYDIKAPV